MRSGLGSSENGRDGGMEGRGGKRLSWRLSCFILAARPFARAAGIVGNAGIHRTAVSCQRDSLSSPDRTSVRARPWEPLQR
jgi:hypothetical protein